MPDVDRAELYDLWSRNSDRPAFVREYREAIHEHTDTADPIPDGSLAAVRRWMNRYKSVVTKQLRDGETTNPDAAEPEA